MNKWQLGGIMNFNTGGPVTFTTGTAVGAANGTQTISNVQAQPDAVGPLPKAIGHISKLPNGVFYFNGYTQSQDPGIAGVTTANGLNTAYSNKAIFAPNGQPVLVNPQPGEVGTMGLATVKGPRSLSFDMNMIKRFRLRGEYTNFEFRLDAINILNHPNFANPNMNINGVGTFGQITTAGNGRRFVLNTRVNF